MSRPFMENLLWEGKIAKANYPKSSAKPNMKLPLINKLTGKVMDPGFKPEDLNKSYSRYSQDYWAGVEERKIKYRNLKLMS
jgi:hypothetical protein